MRIELQAYFFPAIKVALILKKDEDSLKTGF